MATHQGQLALPDPPAQMLKSAASFDDSGGSEKIFRQRNLRPWFVVVSSCGGSSPCIPHLGPAEDPPRAPNFAQVVDITSFYDDAAWMFMVDRTLQDMK